MRIRVVVWCKILQDLGCQNVQLVEGKSPQLRFTFNGIPAQAIGLSVTRLNTEASVIEAGRLQRELIRLRAQPGVLQVVQEQFRKAQTYAGEPSWPFEAWAVYRGRKRAWRWLDSFATGFTTVEEYAAAEALLDPIGGQAPEHSPLLGC